MSLGDLSDYVAKCLRSYAWNLMRFLNRHLLVTYPLIEDCARCEDCGRNVHDYHVPDSIWTRVYGSSGGVLCYDCFCNRADERIGAKWRMNLVEAWRHLKL